MASMPTILRYEQKDFARHAARAESAADRRAIIEAWCNTCGVSLTVLTNGDLYFNIRPHARATWRVWTAVFSSTPDRANIPEKVEKVYDYVQLLFHLENWIREARLS